MPAFGNGSLADAGITDEQRIVLLASAQHLNGTQNLGLATDERIDLAVACLAVEVDAIGIERVLAGLSLFAFGSLVLVDTTHVARLGHARTLGDPMTDVLNRVEAGHLLLLQEVGSVTFALGENRNQDVGAGHFLASRRLHMHNRAVDHTLETRRRLSLRYFLGHQSAKVVVEIPRYACAQGIEIDSAGAHDGRGIAIVEQREQQMLERRVLVTTLVCSFQGAVKRAFKAF